MNVSYEIQTRKKKKNKTPKETGGVYAMLFMCTVHVAHTCVWECTHAVKA